MKKFFVSLVLLGGILFSTANLYGQSDQSLSGKQLDKAVKQSVKAKSKEMKKGKWNITGTSLPLKIALDRHYRALLGNDNFEIMANVGMCQSLNVCSSQAQNNALVTYANAAGSYIRGRVASDMGNNASATVPEELDSFYAAYVRLVSQEIKGEVQFSIAFERPNRTGREYQAIFLVNQDKASAQRMRAYQLALQEQKLAQEYAEKISEFVKEGFQDF